MNIKIKNLFIYKKTRIGLTTLAVLLVAAIVWLAFFHEPENSDFFNSSPTIEIETPNKISVKSSEPFTLDVTLTSYGDTSVIFPAASASISFDSSRLEFLGIDEGNILIRSDTNSAGVSLASPAWSVNPDVSNEKGQINIIYLDMTGGKYAFCSDGYDSKNRNVLFRLKFKLRGSAVSGDIFELAFTDAVMSASDSSQSLAVSNETLNIKNSRIVVSD